MHVGSCIIFQGKAPSYNDLLAHIESRLQFVPRYRQKLTPVPLAQGRPVWADDPNFNLSYHVRHVALPEPGSETELKNKAGRIFSQMLDRSKPLWEIYLVEGLKGNRFALIGKTHHCLVDGVSGVDIVSVLFDITKEGFKPDKPARQWLPQPLPTRAQLLAQVLAERITIPNRAIQTAKRLLESPQKTLSKLQQHVAGISALAWAGLDPAPESPLNIEIGPHRRFEWITSDLQQFKQIKNRLGGTVNDVVLAVVAGALRKFLSGRGNSVRDLSLKVLVPVSVQVEHDAEHLGNHITAMTATLPIYEKDPFKRIQLISEEMASIKESGQAVGARALTELAGFAPPTIASQAARVQAKQRFFNLLVTNIPGPQQPLYLLGRKMLNIYPQVPLAEMQGLAIAVISYNGKMNFGLIGDYDALSDLRALTDYIQDAIDELLGTATLREEKPKDELKDPGQASWLPQNKTRRQATRSSRRRPTAKQSVKEGKNN